MVTASFAPPRMTLLAYWHSVGTRNFDAVCRATGLSPEYLRIVAYGYKRLKPESAQRVIKAAEQVTPGWLPDFELLTRRATHRGSRRSERGLIPASVDYILWDALHE